MSRVNQWLKKQSVGSRIMLGVAGAGLLFTGAAVAGANQPVNTHNASVHKVASTPKVTKKTVTETQVIPFGSTTVNDGALAKGTTKVTTVGVNGSKTLTYEVTYNNGKQTAKTLTKTEITLQPVTQVTTIGTYVTPPPPTCPNGSYVNSAGNTVCSPSSSSAGATAQCVDGTYSYSQSRSGTCSHHGGVATWL